ncbi:MGMT family protein [Crateriforma spongiae]|uniref:MGMT family protein n=1 Tax=Crateriforma spongiae TaxID=2724528 RepID=UPI001444F36F|nr:MGMT family protein [Crateriforma spongiae]
MSNRSDATGDQSRCTTNVDTDMWAAFAKAVEGLRPGEVVSYGDIALAAGYPRRHRAVGTLLRQSLDALPWWRVVYSSGHLPPVNPTLQASRLMDEGVQISGLKVTRSPLGRFAEA